MSGEFVPTAPSPLAKELEQHRFTSETGGELVSPVFDLLQAARETEQLSDLSSSLDRLPDPVDSAQLRSKLVLQMLVAMELNQKQAIDRYAPRLFSLNAELLKQRDVNYWPELHLISWSIDRRENYRLVGNLLSDLFIQRISIGMDDLWKSHILAWMGRYEEHLDARRGAAETHPNLPKGWISVTRANARSRGVGFPPLRWRFKSPSELVTCSGHDEDYLMFQSPLLGNYQVESEMANSGGCHIQLGGYFVGPKNGQRKVAMGTFLTGERVLQAEIPKAKRDKTLRYRGDVRDGVATVFLNGSAVQEYALEGPSAAWLALRRHPTSQGDFLNVQISGEPEIPESISMSSIPTLNDWIPYYLFSESAGTDASEWMWVDGDDQGFGHIVGHRSNAVRGSSFESLLRYQRPLVEDGSIEYDFWYRPGECNAHPAFDRLVFLIQPDGVRIHWLTDGRYDPTIVPPDNVTDEPENRRGPANLPLKLDGWNRMKVTTAGNVVTLALNGTLIYHRALEPTNARTFGLFHYADREELRVRDAVMRGDWPRSLPSLEEQELSDPLLSVIDKDLDHLQAEFKHDFAKDSIPEEYFKFVGKDAALKFTQRSDGVVALLTPYGQWNALGLSPHFGVQGDFDIEFGFAQLQLNEIMTRGEILLQLVLEDEETHWLRAARGLQENSDEYFNGGVSYLDNPEKRRFSGARTGEGSDSGRLRIARRGTDLYTMFAEGDSPIFRIIKHENVPEADVQMHGIELKLSLKDGESVSAVWKHLSIRAERMTYLAPKSAGNYRRLMVMNADGTNLRKAKAKLPTDAGLGSPEYSPDGKQVVLDVSGPSMSQFHIFMFDREGTEAHDLGNGCMPSLSRDGKQVLFSQSGEGIIMMNVDGTNRRVIDESGWGSQFSPDGKYLAYGNRGNIVLMDLKSEAKRSLIVGEDARQHTYSYWNMAWSKDSRSIVFKSRNGQTGEQELAIVDITDPPKLQVLYSTPDKLSEDATFSPDGKTVLFSLTKDNKAGPRFYIVRRDKPGEIEYFEPQPASRKNFDSVWSPDGREIMFSSIEIPHPVPWPLAKEIDAKP